jgi:hypothetical protein
MFENTFGYDTKMPEKIREIYMWLCQDVASLQSKWDFYLELYDKKETTDLLNELASWSFNLIEESLRNDMTMAICRLRDPLISFNKENLSLATLIEKCSDIPGLGTQLKHFQDASEAVSKVRNKQVGHNDLNTVIRPRENPLPGINKTQIDQILKLATDILKVVSLHYSDADVNFHTIARGGAEDLIFWLKAGQEYHSRD